MGALRTHVEGMIPATPQSALKGAGAVDDKENDALAAPNVSATPQSVRTTAPQAGGVRGWGTGTARAPCRCTGGRIVMDDRRVRTGRARVGMRHSCHVLAHAARAG
jgi:hypothetical protein